MQYTLHVSHTNTCISTHKSQRTRSLSPSLVHAVMLPQPGEVGNLVRDIEGLQDRMRSQQDFKAGLVHAHANLVRCLRFIISSAQSAPENFTITHVLQRGPPPLERLSSISASPREPYPPEAGAALQRLPQQLKAELARSELATDPHASLLGPCPATYRAAAQLQALLQVSGATSSCKSKRGQRPHRAKVRRGINLTMK